MFMISSEPRWIQRESPPLFELYQHSLLKLYSYPSSYLYGYRSMMIRWLRGYVWRELVFKLENPYWGGTSMYSYIPLFLVFPWHERQHDIHLWLSWHHSMDLQDWSHNHWMLRLTPLQKYRFGRLTEAKCRQERKKGKRGVKSICHEESVLVVIRGLVVLSPPVRRWWGIPTTWHDMRCMAEWLPTLYSSPLASKTFWHSAICGPTEGVGRPIGMRQTSVDRGVSYGN